RRRGKIEKPKEGRPKKRNKMNQTVLLYNDETIDSEPWIPSEDEQLELLQNETIEPWVPSDEE
ncbi:hypothetical protein CHS0354_030394, partial [Potamilus streckersoni]